MSWIRRWQANRLSNDKRLAPKVIGALGIGGGTMQLEPAFVAGNATRIPHGGRVSLTIATAMYLTFRT
jgi:K+ transporter